MQLDGSCIKPVKHDYLLFHKQHLLFTNSWTTLWGVISQPIPFKNYIVSLIDFPLHCSKKAMNQTLMFYLAWPQQAVHRETENCQFHSPSRILTLFKHHPNGGGNSFPQMGNSTDTSSTVWSRGTSTENKYCSDMLHPVFQKHTKKKFTLKPHKYHLLLAVFCNHLSVWIFNEALLLTIISLIIEKYFPVLNSWLILKQLFYYRSFTHVFN